MIAFGMRRKITVCQAALRSGEILSAKNFSNLAKHPQDSTSFLRKSRILLRDAWNILTPDSGNLVSIFVPFFFVRYVVSRYATLSHSLTNVHRAIFSTYDLV